MQALLFHYQSQISLTFKTTVFWFKKKKSQKMMYHVFKLIKQELTQVLIRTTFHSHPASFNDSKDSRQ